MSKAHLPPVPAQNRSQHGVGASPKESLNPKRAQATAESRNIDPTKQGQQGGVAQNTHHPGYQQDR